VAFTKGFYSYDELAEHFEDHKGDFDAKDEAEYLALADAFLGGPMRDTTLECPKRRRDGCLTRYDYHTQEFGVLSPDGYIITYYKPKPNVHRLRTNRIYWNSDCRKKKI
jgi:pyocin large subunit-like protein